MAYGTTAEDYMALAMEIVVAADYDIDEDEMALLETIGRQMPRFKSINLHEKLAEAVRFILDSGFQDALKHFEGITDETLKKTCLVLALEAAMANGEVSETEEDTLAELASVMGIDDDTLGMVVDVVSWKYA